MEHRLVLWDVDHTLVECTGVIAQVYPEAFRRVFGRDLERVPYMAGQTELSIQRDLFDSHGLAMTPELIATFNAELVSVFGSLAGTLPKTGRALPGAERALAALADTPNVVQSVLTGNVPELALGKLAAFGLDRYLDLTVGAYGSERLVRAELVPLARQRAAARHGIAFDPETTVLVGDTPFDVAAGRDGGAVVVAVATGRSSAAELREAGAQVVLADLSDTPAVLAAILR
jgi:phosphoglycolate phosphatase-like HAD superfamily hydrolase